MIFQSKVILRIVSRFAVSPVGSVVAKRLPLAGSNPQSSPIFAIRGTPAPLLAHIGGSHKVIPPPASKLAVSDDF